MTYKTSNEYRIAMVALYEECVRRRHAVAIKYMTYRDKMMSERSRSMYLRFAKNWCRMAMESYTNMREWECQEEPETVYLNID